MPSLVQVVPGGASGSNTLNITIAATGAGNTLVALILDAATGNNGTPNAVTLGGVADNWAQAAIQGSATDHAVAAGWVDANCAGGQTAVQITTTGATGTEQLQAWIFEWAGLSGTLDQTSGGANGSVGAWTSGATGVTAQASEVAFGVTGGTVAGGGTGSLTGPSSPWVNESSQQLGTKIALAGYLILSSTQTVTYNGTASPNNTNDTLVFTLPAASGGVTVNLPVAQLALAAPAGSVLFPATVNLPVAQLALAAPAGTPAGSGAATVALPVAQLALAAPVGSAGTGTGGGDDDPPWHIRRR